MAKTNNSGEVFDKHRRYLHNSILFTGFKGPNETLPDCTLALLKSLIWKRYDIDAANRSHDARAEASRRGGQRYRSQGSNLFFFTSSTKSTFREAIHLEGSMAVVSRVVITIIEPMITDPLRPLAPGSGCIERARSIR